MWLHKKLRNNEYMILAGLLKLLGTMNLDVYFVPLADEHFNENLAPTDRRVNVLTGFSGTYGMAIAGKVNVFMTSFQFETIAKQEIQNFSVIIEGDDFDLGTYLQAKGVKTAGINPKLILSKTYKQLEAGLNAKGITLTPIDEDLVDKIWTGKPKKEFKSILSIEKVKMKEFIDVNYVKLFKRLAIGPPRILYNTSKDSGPKSYDLNVSVTGESYKTRIKKIQTKLKEGQGLVVADLDSIAWMTNLRGHDIDFAPSFFSFMYMTKKSVKLFTGYPVTLNGVQVLDYNDFYDFLSSVNEKEILLSGDVNYEIFRRMNKPEYSNIILDEEVQKNNIELFGYKNAGVKDGAALVKLFAWIEKNIDTGITELAIRRKMFKLKSEQKGYFSESFEPLVAAGTNSARIYHKATNKVLQKGEILLLDTGTHYFHGTTDLTRTLVFGTPRSDVIKYYTIVLKSLLDSKFIVKRRIKGKDIEELARKYLREIGRDYPTMSGHGVGYFGQVHEKIPKLGFKDDKLRTFNTYTLEPTYFDDEMGIRIEDMVFNNRYKSFFYQTNLTYVPLDLKLIDPDELNDKQLNFLNDYSSRVREFLKPLLKDDKDAIAYLIKNTKKLSRSKEYKPTLPKKRLCFKNPQMLRRIPFNNKLLSLEQKEDSIYIGDSRGHIYKMDYPFYNPTKVHNVSSPISSLLWHKNRLFYANWDGEVGFTDFSISKSISLVRDIVKCMTIFKNHIFVSIDHIIYILDLDLKPKGRLEPPHKVLSFFSTENKCHVGMSVPFLGEIVKNDIGDFELVNIKNSKHDTAILSIHKDLTGSSDGKIMRGDNIIYSSSGWINSIFSENLFSCGRSIILKNENGFKEIYAHKDDVMKVLRIKNKIISIGLDYTVCVWEEEMITEEELKEIQELNKNF